MAKSKPLSLTERARVKEIESRLHEIESERLSSPSLSIYASAAATHTYLLDNSEKSIGISARTVDL